MNITALEDKVLRRLQFPSEVLNSEEDGADARFINVVNQIAVHAAIVTLEEYEKARGEKI